MQNLLTVRPIVCLGEIVMSNFPVPFAENESWCRTLMGIATLLWDPIRYDISLKFPSGGINDKILSDYFLEKKSREKKISLIYVVLDGWIYQVQTYLPSFETHTWMKTGIVKHTWIHKRHAKVRHPREFNNTINLK